MSFITDIGRSVLGENLYKDCLTNLYGIQSGNVNIINEFNRYMIITALDLNDTQNYYTQEQLDCLNGKIHRGKNNPNPSPSPQPVNPTPPTPAPAPIIIPTPGPAPRIIPT